MPTAIAASPSWITPRKNSDRADRGHGLTHEVMAAVTRAHHSRDLQRNRHSRMICGGINYTQNSFKDRIPSSGRLSTIIACLVHP
jgi:hypothetical protein